jgi:alpha-galactosidase/6-phospho-beta-glucosidase family protein
MLPTKIVVIGAGSAIFGLNTVAALLRSERLRGSQLALVDRNGDTLGLIGSLAGRLNREWQAEMTITTHTHHADALEDAEFVVSAIEVPPREALWRSDYEITLKYGLRQPYAENGGPGGFAHAARNIGPVLEIVRAMELACPDAWFINFTNPMIRICDAIARYSDIQVVGLCHQIGVGYAMVGQALAEDYGFEMAEGFTSTHASPTFIPAERRMAAQALARFDIKAAGLNHFTWMLDVRDKQTGEDLYPLFAERWAALDPSFEPLTRRVYEVFDWFPIPGDEHLCEYLPWVSDPQVSAAAKKRRNSRPVLSRLRPLRGRPQSGRASRPPLEHLLPLRGRASRPPRPRSERRNAPRRRCAPSREISRGRASASSSAYARTPRRLATAFRCCGTCATRRASSQSTSTRLARLWLPRRLATSKLYLV